MREISKIVLERLQKESAGEVHPEENLLTAFAERGLGEAERSKVMEHLAYCGECRDVVALALPALEEMGVSDVVVESRRTWFSWPALRWGLAAAGMAVIASVGVVQLEHRQLKDGALFGETTRNEPAASSVQDSAPAGESPVALEKQSAEISRKNDPIVQGGLAKRKQTRSSLPKGRAEDESATVAENQIPKNLEDQLVHRSAASTDVVKAKNFTPAETSGAITGPNVPLQTEPAMMARALPRWSLSSNGGLQRSFDAGSSWEVVNVEAADNLPQAAGEGSEAQSEKKAAAIPVFRALAAIGPEVWAGGSNGVLYHSADSGTLWMRIYPSSGDAVLAGDIVGIEFSDAQHGAITTSSGEVWTTSDNGHNWLRRP